MRRLRTVLVCVGLVLMVGCTAQPQISSAWQNPKYQRAHFKRVLVVALARSNAARRIIEDELVQQLQVEGAEAVAGYRVFPRTDELDQDTLTKTSFDVGAEVVMVARLVRLEPQSKVHPGYVGRPGAGVYGYDEAWAGFYEPPSPTDIAASPDLYQATLATVETHVFDTATNECVWFGSSKPFSVTEWKQDALVKLAELSRALAKVGLV